jgi:multidrug resistance efflux pump
MSDWDDLVGPARAAFEELLRNGDAMADRIEKLEAKGRANRAAIMRLEATLAKALEALERVMAGGNRVSYDVWRCWRSIMRARDTLAELKGQEDE